MDREELKKKMDDMYKRAKKARTDGKRELGRSFRSGARRLERQLNALPKPKKAEAPAEAPSAPAAPAAAPAAT